MINPTAKITAEKVAEKVVEDFPYDLRYYKPKLISNIAKALSESAAQAREEGFDEGYKKGVEAQFNEAESITVRRITPSRYVQGFEQAREMAAKVGDYFGLPQGHIIASEIRALKPRARGSGD